MLDRVRHFRKIDKQDYDRNIGASIGIGVFLVLSAVYATLDSLNGVQAVLLAYFTVGLAAFFIERYAGDTRAPRLVRGQSPKDLRAVQAATTSYLREAILPAGLSGIASRAGIDRAGGERVHADLGLHNHAMPMALWGLVRGLPTSAKRHVNQAVKKPVIFLVWGIGIVLVHFILKIDLVWICGLVLLAIMPLLACRYAFLQKTGTRLLVTDRRILQVHEPFSLWRKRPVRTKFAVDICDLVDVRLQLSRIGEGVGYLHIISSHPLHPVWLAGPVSGAAEIPGVINHVKALPRI